MRLRWYGWLGLVIVISAEIFLFLRHPFVSKWFTPIVWSGYILFADGVALRLRGRSLIHDQPLEALMMAWLSVGCWLLFEVYNLRLKNWYYVGVPEHPVERDLAYLWSFATIMPGLFETADVLEGLGFLRRMKCQSHNACSNVSGRGGVHSNPPAATSPHCPLYLWLRLGGIHPVIGTVQHTVGSGFAAECMGAGRSPPGTQAVGGRHDMRSAVGVLELLGNGRLALHGPTSPRFRLLLLSHAGVGIVRLSTFRLGVPGDV